MFKTWLAQMRQSTIDPSSAIRFPDAAEHAVFLSPHHDDICFSLGALIHRLQTGILLNVFSRSGHVARRDLAPKELAAPDMEALGQSPPSEAGGAWVNWVTQWRKDEDQTFAQACGLRSVQLDLPEAPLRGQDPFKGHSTANDARNVEAALMAALNDLAPKDKSIRPWLFCPAGIGGHIDHLLVRDAVLQKIEDLRRLYRIAFYEDLHYASDRRKRWRGLADFRDAAKGLCLARVKLPIGSRAEEKLRLVQLYASQLTPQLMDITRYSPPAFSRAGLHEAVWIVRENARV